MIKSSTNNLKNCGYIAPYKESWDQMLVSEFSPCAVKICKICTQCDLPPSKNADFDRFRLIVPQPWVLARKVQLSLIAY